MLFLVFSKTKKVFSKHCYQYLKYKAILKRERQDGGRVGGHAHSLPQAKQTNKQNTSTG